tara:strand:- start:169 stop:1275 length:1107 start_codon:yes stop_codon:yes gene_type:complete
MNIAIFSPNKNPYSETFIQAHKNFLKGNIFYYYGDGSNINLEGDVDFLSSNRRRYLKIKKNIFGLPQDYIHESKILRSLYRNKIEVILIEYGTHASDLLPILKKAKLPFVVHFHGYDASVHEIIKQYGNYKELFNLSKYIIVVSKKMYIDLNKLGCPEFKLVYNTSGPHSDFSKIKTNCTQLQFISVGRFVDKKAPYYTIIAFKKVVEKYPNSKLLMAGDGPLFNVCINLVKYYHLEKNIKFLGIISPDEFKKLLTHSLAFVQHSITAMNGDTEGTPVAILEASAAGLPVIATNHAGIPDIIVNEKSGLLCEEHDVEGMAKNMLRLIEDPKLVKNLGEYGKENIMRNFSMKRHIDSLQKSLEQAILLF